MKTLLLIFFPFLLHAQGYVTFDARVNNIHPVMVSATGGYMMKNGLTAEAAMYVQMSRAAAAYAYFTPQAGYTIPVSPMWLITPFAGYGYKLVSEDDKRFNSWQYVYGIRVTREFLNVNIARVDKQAYISIGITGIFNK